MVTSTERVRRWREANPEKWREHQRNYRKRNRRGCLTCGTALPFPSQGVRYCSDVCRPDQSAILRKRRLQTLQDYKLKRGCDTCGYNKSARSLDFHHRDPLQKKHRVWVPYGEEYEKCDLLCKNCHYELHDEKNQRKRRRLLIRLKEMSTPQSRSSGWTILF